MVAAPQTFRQWYHNVGSSSALSASVSAPVPRWPDEETGLSARSSIASCGMDQPSGDCRSLSFGSGMEHERTATPLSRRGDDDAPFERPHPSGGGVDVSETMHELGGPAEPRALLVWKASLVRHSYSTGAYFSKSTAPPGTRRKAR